MNPNIINLKDLDSPSLIVFPEIVKKNIQLALNMIAEPDRLRPHIKTHKTREVIELCQAKGIEKYKCATISEAELLGICKAKDVLLAYQPVGPKAIRYTNLIQNFGQTKFSCLIDSEPVAQNLNEIGQKTGINFSVFVDINIGQNRTGILPEKVVEFCENSKQFSNVTIIGLHAYDGHIYDANFADRKEKADVAYEIVKKLQIQLQDLLKKDLVLIMSGSPTFSIHAKRTDIECSPGTFVFWDLGYSQFAEQSFEPAVYLLGRVISKPNTDLICVDIGHKSVAAERPLAERIQFLNVALEPISQSEEHLVLKVMDKKNYTIGNELLGIPIHICPTVALHEKLYTVENERLTGNFWEILARNRELNF